MGCNITLIYADTFAATVQLMDIFREIQRVIFRRMTALGPNLFADYQLATDLLKMSVMILSVVVRTALGSLLMVEMLRLAA